MGTPTYKYRPDFKPGSEPCRIQIYSRARGRLTVSNFFLRSKFQGPSANDIAVESVWYDGPNGTGNPTTSSSSVQSVVVTVTSPDYPTEVYIDDMEYDGMDWLETGLGVRSQMNDSSLMVEYNGSDVQAPVTPPDYVPYFSSTNLSGASGYPSPPGSSIRTGPERSLILLKSEERPNGSGGNPIDSMLEWNGSKWIEYKEE